jgi:hypothetical protein
MHTSMSIHWKCRGYPYCTTGHSVARACVVHATRCDKSRDAAASRWRRFCASATRCAAGTHTHTRHVTCLSAGPDAAARPSPYTFESYAYARQERGEGAVRVSHVSRTCTARRPSLTRQIRHVSSRHPTLPPSPPLPASPPPPPPPPAGASAVGAPVPPAGAARACVCPQTRRHVKARAVSEGRESRLRRRHRPRAQRRIGPRAFERPPDCCYVATHAHARTHARTHAHEHTHTHSASGRTSSTAATWPRTTCWYA